MEKVKITGISKCEWVPGGSGRGNPAGALIDGRFYCDKSLAEITGIPLKTIKRRRAKWAQGHWDETCHESLTRKLWDRSESGRGRVTRDKRDKVVLNEMSKVASMKW